MGSAPGDLGLSPASVTVNCVSRRKSEPSRLGSSALRKGALLSTKSLSALISNNSMFCGKKAPSALRKCSELAQD